MTEEWHSPVRGGPEGHKAAMGVFSDKRLGPGTRGARRQRSAQAFRAGDDNADFDATEEHISPGGDAAISPGTEMPGEGSAPSLKVTRGGHHMTTPGPAVQLLVQEGLADAISSIRRALTDWGSGQESDSSSF